MAQDLGLKETARNTAAQLGGAPIDGDIGLEAERFLVYVTLFSDQRLSRQAELGLRAKPDVRDAIAKGATAVRTVDRVVFVANGRGSVVDEFRLDEVVRVVSRMAVPPPLQAALSASGPRIPAPDPDALEQLRKLGDLHTAGVLTDAEFDAKKAAAEAAVSRRAATLNAAPLRARQRRSGDGPNDGEDKVRP